MTTTTDNAKGANISFLSKDSAIVLNDKPFYINIVVERKNRVFTNKFDDTIYWLWKDDTNTWNLKSTNCTSKAGLYYAQNPLSSLGTGILKTGYYKGSHKLGYHKGKYVALVQNKELPVWRDNDKDDWIDYVKEEEGWFGINIHRANPSIESINVDKWSAACIVFSNPKAFTTFIKQCQKHESIYGNSFDLNLINKL